MTTTIDITVPTTKTVTVPTPHMVDSPSTKWRIWTETAMDYEARTSDIWYNEDADICKEQHDRVMGVYFDKCDAYVAGFRNLYRKPADVPADADALIMRWRIDIPTGRKRDTPDASTISTTLYAYRHHVTLANVNVYNEPDPNALYVASQITHIFVRDYALKYKNEFLLTGLA